MFAIENVAPPVVETEIEDGKPAAMPVSLKDVYGPADGRPVAVNSLNSAMELTFQAVTSAVNADEMVSVPLAVYVIDLPLIVIEYIWLVTVPERETVQTSATGTAVPSHLLVVILYPTMFGSPTRGVVETNWYAHFTEYSTGTPRTMTGES